MSADTAFHSNDPNGSSGACGTGSRRKTKPVKQRLQADSALRGSSLHFSPLVAQTRSLHTTVDPVAYDCVKITFVRAGGALLFSEFETWHINVGDVVVLAANTLCGAEPESWVTTTTLYMDRDYVVDQIFWQHAALLVDRLDARDFVDELYSEPAQVLSLGEDRVGLMLPWLDELVALSIDGPSPERFYRMQSLLFAVLDVVAPYIKTTPTRRSPTQRKANRPGGLRHRRFAPMRSEASRIRDLLRDDPARSWSMVELAGTVHLSPKQLSRVFSDAFGLTPRAYQTRLRVAEMARLLRETDTPITEAGRLVGWSSRSRAHDAFKECTGMSPREYRSLREAG